MGLEGIILKNKIKLLTTICGCGISTCSIPVLLAYTDSVNGVDKLLSHVPDLGMKQRGEELSKQYKSQVSDIKPKDFAELDQIKETYKNTQETVTKVAKLVFQKKVNYYLFEYGHMVKGLGRWIPEIVSTSLESEEDLGPGKLNVQKIYAIVSDEEFEEFAKKIAETVGKFPQVVERMTQKEADMFFEQFKQIKKDQINATLKKIGDNTKDLETSYDGCPTKLLLHIFTGKTNVESTKKQLTDLKSTVNSASALLGAAAGTGGGATDTIEEIKEKLKTALEKLNELSCDPGDTTNGNTGSVIT